MSETKSPKELEKEGNAAYKQGNFITAAHEFEAASKGYAMADDHLKAAEMANNSSVAFLQAGNAEKALEVLNGTTEVFANSGDLKRQGMAIGNKGAALEELGHLEEAEQAYRDSAEILEKAGEDKLRAEVMKSLSTLQLNTGRQLQALATMQSGVEGVKSPSPKQSFLKRLLQIPIDMINKNKV